MPGAPRGGTVTSRIRSAGTADDQVSTTRSRSWRQWKDTPSLGGAPSCPRTDATKSAQVVVPPLTIVCCQADTSVRAMSRAPITTCTRWPASARTSRRAWRGRARDSSSSETTTVGPSWAVHEVDQPAQRPGGLAALLAAHTLAEQVVGRETLGTVAPREEHPRGGELLRRGREGALDRGRPCLVETHVEEDVRHDDDARNGGGQHMGPTSRPAGNLRHAAGTVTYPIAGASDPRHCAGLSCAA